MAAVARFGAGDSTSAIAASGTGAALSVAKPSNVAVGDLLIGNFYNQFSGTVTSPPSGWTLVKAWASRSGGVYSLAVTDATVLAGLAASWSATMSGSGRLCDHVFRITGADLTAPIDVVGAEASQNALASFTLPSVTPTNAGGLLLAFAYWNNSSTTQSTYTPDAAMTDGEQVKSPTTGNTSGIDIAYQQLAAAGATGTRTVSMSPTGASNGGFMLVVKAAAAAITGTVALAGAGVLAITGTPKISGTVTLAGDGSLAVTAAGSFTGTVALSGAGALAVTGTPVIGGTVPLVGAGALIVRTTTPVDAWLANRPLHIAHRGGSADWVEHTMFAYDQAAAWNQSLAFEVSVWQTSDGVWVCSHDQSTLRIFGVDYDITAAPWATLAPLVTTTGGYPTLRLDTFLAKYGGRRVIVVDDKGSQDTTSLLNILDSAGGAGWYITKSYYTAVAWPTAARSRGYRTLGYYYDADTAQIASTNTRFDVLMEQFDASSSSWSAIKSVGKPVLAHIIATSAQKGTATTNGADGYMASGVQEVVPQAPALVALAGSGALTISGLQRLAGVVALAGAGVLAARTGSTVSGAVALTGQGALTVTGTPIIDGLVALAGGGTLAAAGEPAIMAVIALTGSGSLVLIANLRDITVVVSGPYRHPLRDATPQGNPLRVTGPAR